MNTTKLHFSTDDSTIYQVDLWEMFLFVGSITSPDGRLGSSSGVQLHASKWQDGK
jgi:hypothetical protein